MAIATPLMSLKEDFEDEKLEKGNLGIPLSRDGETASVFYPGGFEDMEEQNELVSLSKLFGGTTLLHFLRGLLLNIKYVQRLVKTIHQ